MTIQVSVTIWTVICFVLLMLILHNLLFKPILSVMDARRERIENAARKKAEYEEMEKRYQAIRVEQEAAAYATQQRQTKAAVDAARSENKKIVETAKLERIRRVDNYREKARAEHEEDLHALHAYAMELATAFADRLTKE